MRFILGKDGWFIDSLDKQRFHITEFVQPNHPVIRELAKGKTAQQISDYWRDEYEYDNSPPSQLFLFESYALEAPDCFKPSDMIDYIFETKKADCWGGSFFVASLLSAAGYDDASVVLGRQVSTLDSQIKRGHA